MNLFSALADPTRLNIVEMLAARGELSATDIGNKFSVSPPAISQHLKILREARLVEVEKRAQKRIYKINPRAINEIESWAQKNLQLWNERFDALDELLQKQNRKGAHHARKSR